MTLKEYRAFILSIELGSISKAAEELGSTQSAVTRLILNLEEELGFSVMKRNKSGTALTDAGARLYHTIKDIVDGDKKVESLAQKIKGENTNRVTIGTFSSVAVNWLPSIMGEFKRLHSEVEFGLINGNYDDISKALEDGVCDVGFITLPTLSNLKCYPLVKDRILAVLPLNHPLSCEREILVEEFAKEPVISLPEQTDLDSRTVFKRAGITPNIAYRTNDDYAMISMVENNLGICLAPELILKGRMDNVKVLETNPPSFRTIALAVPYEKTASTLTVAFAQFVLEWIKENCDNAL
jgi:DNA-binding transcriptional LysR family regulator